MAAGNLNPANFVFRLKQHYNFKNAHNYFTVLKFENCIKNIDCCVIGSDTLWDVTAEYYKKHHDVFCGSSFQENRYFTYAVSAGNSTEEDFSLINNPFSFLKSAFAVSVRDVSSKKLVRFFAKRDAKIVCDPTFLSSRTIYGEIEKSIRIRRYLLLYYFGRIDKDLKEEIVLFSRKKKLKIVSFGEYRRWCDVSIPYDPFYFLSYYHHSDFVITNTFHGSIFSLIYEKPFVSLAAKKNKVMELLEEFGLSYRNTNRALNIKDILEYKEDPILISSKINEISDSSMRYILKCLEKA
jgi:polysaccharide pyruvyl transferase WcaK-like protein